MAIPRIERQHEVLRDATLTFAHILKTQLPPKLDKKQQIHITFEVPTEPELEKAKKEGKITISVILVDAVRSPVQQKTEEPIIRDEDEEGNIIEYKLGQPNFIEPRYLMTPWSGDPLLDQVVLGLMMNVFFARPQFEQEDIQGVSIKGDSAPPVRMLESFGIEKQMALWQAMNSAHRPSAVYGVTVRMDSMRRSVVRRVKERILDFKKIEG